MYHPGSRSPWFLVRSLWEVRLGDRRPGRGRGYGYFFPAPSFLAGAVSPFPVASLHGTPVTPYLLLVPSDPGWQGVLAVSSLWCLLELVPLVGSLNLFTPVSSTYLKSLQFNHLSRNADRPRLIYTETKICFLPELYAHHGLAGSSAQGLRLTDALTPQHETSTFERESWRV